MKKRILPILLLISPYLYALTVMLYCKFGGAREMESFILIFCGMVVIIFIPNMIYAFVIGKHGESSDVILFWDMILKLCNIPIYIVIFCFGFFMSLFPKGMVISFPLAIFDYLLLIPSSIYGVSGLIQACRERKITKATAVVNGILHFFFCMDVISAIAMFCLVKAKSTLHKF